MDVLRDIGIPWRYRFGGFCAEHCDTMEFHIRWILCRVSGHNGGFRLGGLCVVYREHHGCSDLVEFGRDIRGTMEVQLRWILCGNGAP